MFKKLKGACGAGVGCTALPPAPSESFQFPATELRCSILSAEGREVSFGRDGGSGWNDDSDQSAGGSKGRLRPASSGSSSNGNSWLKSRSAGAACSQFDSLVESGSDRASMRRRRSTSGTSVDVITPVGLALQA